MFLGAGLHMKKNTAMVQCHVGQSPLAQILLDHWVQGLPVVAGCAFLEAALAASLPLCAAGSRHVAPDGSHLTTSMLRMATVLAPCVLGGDTATATLQIELDLSSGSVFVSSIDGSAHQQRHLASNVGRLAAPPLHHQKTKLHQGLENILDLSVVLPPQQQQDQAAHPVADLARTDSFAQASFCLDPAVMDSCLHLGAHLAVTAGIPIRVPASMEVVSAHKILKNSLGMAAGASVPRDGSDGSTTDFFTVAAPSHPETARSALGYHIAGLMAKPLTKQSSQKVVAHNLPFTSSSRNSIAPEEAASVTRQVLYASAWQVQRSVSTGPLPLAYPSASSSTLIIAGGSLDVQIKGSGTTRGRAGTLLSTLQSLMARRSFSGAQVLTHVGMFDEKSMVAQENGEAVTALAWGMTRVAASEGSGQTRWGIGDIAKTTPMKHTGLDSDASGFIIQNGSLELRPLLLPVGEGILERRTGQLNTSHTVQVVTGGLGGEPNKRGGHYKICFVLKTE